MTAPSIPAGMSAHTRRQRLARLKSLRRRTRAARGIQAEPAGLHPHESLPMLWAGHLGGPR